MSEENQTDAAAVLKIRLPADFKEEVERHAESKHISMSALVRLALGEYIKSPEPTPPVTEGKEAA